MNIGRLARWRRSLESLFPERHLYIRSSGEMRGVVLTPGRQITMVAAGVFALGWMVLGGVAMLGELSQAQTGDKAVVKTQARYERLIADREARLNSAVAQLSDTNGSIDDLARSVEKRHAALAMLLTDVKGEPGAAQALAPAPIKVASRSPVDRVRAVRMDQDRLIALTETFSKTRADRLRLAFKLAGLNPDKFTHTQNAGLGGPLITAKDPRALSAVLDVDEEFAERIQHAAQNLSDTRGLSDAATRLPFARPAVNAEQSSGFGVRFDPFTGRAAFHSGLDFAGSMMTPIYSTAPGVISFTGQRSGYGNTVEIDHGGGFKTRYAHLAGISVTVGQRVGVGQRIGAMGSTGRSTGPHLHYEVWVDGRAQNPDRFVKAGDYVQQTD